MALLLRVFYELPRVVHESLFVATRRYESLSGLLLLSDGESELVIREGHRFDFSDRPAKRISSFD